MIALDKHGCGWAFKTDPRWKERTGYFNKDLSELYLIAKHFDGLTGGTGHQDTTLAALAKVELLLPGDEEGRPTRQWIKGLGRVRHYALRLDAFAPEGVWEEGATDE